MNDQIWTLTKDKLRGQINEHIYETWIQPTTFYSYSESSKTLVVSVPNERFSQWLTERYYDQITDIIENISQNKIKIVFTPLKDVEKPDGKQLDWTANYESKSDDFMLSPRYTFDQFVVGSSNRFAHAAAMSVAESPANSYNPLFIYGGVGLGKTHLLQAIGNNILKKHNNCKLYYLSIEKFTTDFINSIRYADDLSFKNKYRNVDVLLIDDIQFLAGKERTQEEFFHTFNALYNAQQQIVISSDRPPKDMDKLEERLRSRFEWGLITDIQAPDLETRIAILHKKSELEKLSIPDDVIYFIANNITSNIRELEGSLIRIVAFASLTNREVSVALAKEILKDVLPRTEQKPTINLIQEKVSKFFNLSVREMKTKKRNQSIAFPRQIAMYLARQLTDMSLPEIGENFGGRDHSTVLHACAKIKKKLEKEEDFIKIINDIKNSIMLK